MATSDSGQDHTWSISEDFVQSPNHKAPVTSSIDFDGLLQPGLKLHENLANGNGGQAWPAGVVLAKYLLRMKRNELQNRSIVELGSGSGLVGLAIAVGCKPNNVHITDQEPMLALMRQNIGLNNLNDQVTAHVYSWGEARPSIIPKHPDIILAADCVYFEPAFPLLQQTLQDLIGIGTVCYFCFKKRRRADSHFMKAVRKTFLVDPVDDDPDHESYSKENIFLYTIRRKHDR